VPAKAAPKGKGKAAPAKPQSEDEQEAESDEEGAEDEYVVERITEHKFARGGAIQYRVKWLGYENEVDMTWEPLENL
jgi:chromobox protein 1